MYNDNPPDSRMETLFPFLSYIQFLFSKFHIFLFCTYLKRKGFVPCKFEHLYKGEILGMRVRFKSWPIFQN